MVGTERKYIQVFWYVEFEVLVSYLNEHVQEKFRNTKSRAKRQVYFVKMDV